MAYSLEVKVYRRGPGLYTLTLKQVDVTTETVTIDPDDPAGDGSEPAIPRRGRILSHRHELQDGASGMSPRLHVQANGDLWLVDAEDSKIVHGPDEPAILYDCLDGGFLWDVNPQGESASQVLTVFHLAHGWGTEFPLDGLEHAP